MVPNQEALHGFSARIAWEETFYMASMSEGMYQPISVAAKRLGITVNALHQRIERGTVRGAQRLYAWRGQWLRLLWHVPRSYK
jgi:hypothetical protein